MRIRLIFAVAATALTLHSAPALAAERVESATKITFADSQTLFIADWKGAHIHAVTLPAAAAQGTSRPFNLQDVQGPIARALHVPRDSIRFEDLAVRPGTESAYVSVTLKHGKSQPTAAVISITADGKVAVLDLRKASIKSIDITDRPAAGKMFWRDLPQQSLTITDMKFYQDKLYVAGLSNQKFASTLRIIDYPFGATPKVSTVEMYHPVHDQIESRAPIRAMSIVMLGGEPTLVAAYTCTPLVTIPLSDIRDGAHITAKTVGELGWGSAPTGMVAFTAEKTDYVLLTNSSRAADLLPLPAIAEGATKAGLSKPINWPTEPLLGVKAITTPMAAVTRLDNLNKELLLALRREDASGAMQLVSIPKGAYLRLSDFVNEYDFDDYKYPPNDSWSGYHKYFRTIEGFPELAR